MDTQQEQLINLMAMTREQLVSVVLRQEREIKYLIEQNQMIDAENDRVLREVSNNPMYFVSSKELRA